MSFAECREIGLQNNKVQYNHFSSSTFKNKILCVGTHSAGKLAQGTYKRPKRKKNQN